VEAIRGSENSEKQEELIRRYCAEAENEIAKAPDYASAKRLKESLCARFEQECESRLIIGAISQHLENLLKQLWGAR
jgi:hypothetical protein